MVCSSRSRNILVTKVLNYQHHIREIDNVRLQGRYYIICDDGQKCNFSLITQLRQF